MNKKFLQLLFCIFFALIAWATVRASLDRNVLEAGRALWPDKWFQATLMDTYLAFLTFYCWVFYKEKSAAARIVWFALIMGLGNFAIALYVLLQLQKTEEGKPEQLLLR